MKAMHSAGVVHLDWYPSNFMWQYKPDSGELSVKIIDFDSAHLRSDSLLEFTWSRYTTRKQHVDTLLQCILYWQYNCMCSIVPTYVSTFRLLSLVLLSIRLSGSRSILANEEVPGRSSDYRNYDISLMKLLYSNQENPGLQSDSKEELDFHFEKIVVSSSNHLHLVTMGSRV